MTKKVIVMTVALLILAACENQTNTAKLDTNQANWDVIAAAPEGTKTKNGFLIMMR
jgi:hypothetical protein